VERRGGKKEKGCRRYLLRPVVDIQKMNEMEIQAAKSDHDVSREEMGVALLSELGKNKRKKEHIGPILPWASKRGMALLVRTSENLE